MKKLKNRWVEGSVQEFLGLSDADMKYIETKRTLAACLREKRMKQHLIQTELAGVTKANRHEAIDDGTPVGREAW